MFPRLGCTLLPGACCTLRIKGVSLQYGLTPQICQVFCHSKSIAQRSVLQLLGAKAMTFAMAAGGHFENGERPLAHTNGTKAGLLQ